jgi:hypothetical protein
MAVLRYFVYNSMCKILQSNIEINIRRPESLDPRSSTFIVIAAKFCTFMVGFRKIFQDHRRLSGQLFESQVAIGNREQCYLKEVTGRFFTKSK